MALLPSRQSWLSLSSEQKQRQKEMEMMEQFVKLCEVGDLKGVEKALQSGTSVNSWFGSKTGLIAALMQKHTAVHNVPVVN